ncbi:MAG: hypothetical protein U9N86_08805 [Bacteroidota bacterium]|nr:hypothetical protein [Bacteroidota bacterium]
MSWKLIKQLFILQVILLSSSCDNEVDVIDKVNSKPVIYSLLNINDTVYSVSLTKTFVGDTNVYVLASNPDNVFYSSANIWLDGLAGDSIIWSTQFYLSDLVKDKGIFPQVSGYLYLSDAVINKISEDGYFFDSYSEIERFRLSIDIEGSMSVISAIVPVYHPNFFLSPYRVHKISLYGREDFEVVIASTKGCSYRQLNMRVRYYEKLIGQEDLENRELEFIVRKDLQVVDKTSIARIPADFFFNKLVANMPIVDNLQYRRFRDFDLLIYSADEIYDNYTETYIYTTDLARPAWSNFENGIGIFSLIFTGKLEGFTFDQRTIDSLALSPVTQSLKFVRWQ